MYCANTTKLKMLIYVIDLSVFRELLMQIDKIGGFADAIKALL